MAKKKKGPWKETRKKVLSSGDARRGGEKKKSSFTSRKKEKRQRDDRGVQEWRGVKTRRFPTGACLETQMWKKKNKSKNLKKKRCKKNSYLRVTRGKKKTRLSDYK